MMSLFYDRFVDSPADLYDEANAVPLIAAIDSAAQPFSGVPEEHRTPSPSLPPSRSACTATSCRPAPSFVFSANGAGVMARRQRRRHEAAHGPAGPHLLTLDQQPGALRPRDLDRDRLPILLRDRVGRDQARQQA